MPTGSDQFVGEPRPQRGFPAEAPPGFFMSEGRSFILVYGERLASAIRRVTRRLGALARSDDNPTHRNA